MSGSETGSEDQGRQGRGGGGPAGGNLNHYLALSQNINNTVYLNIILYLM